jgi:phosphoglycerate dehydrogenase-like enzyme
LTAAIARIPVSRIPVSRIHCYGRIPVRAVAEHQDLLPRWETSTLDDASFADGIGTVEALFCHAPPPGLWASAGRLRLIQLIGAGTDMLLPVPGLPPEVAIANAGGLTSAAMAEFVVAQLLSLVKRLPDTLANQRERAWRTTTPGMLAGRRVTILGLGPAGRQTARLLQPFGVSLTGVSRRGRETPGFDRVASIGDLDPVLAQTDDLIVALPLTAQTRDLLGEAEFARMPPGGHLINVARGGLVDERAMAAALTSGHLAGAAVDTVRSEPLPPGDPLWSCPNLLISAHVSWTTPDLERELIRLLAQNVDRTERGLRPRNEVDRALGYPVA